MVILNRLYIFCFLFWESLVKSDSTHNFLEFLRRITNLEFRNLIKVNVVGGQHSVWGGRS